MSDDSSARALHPYIAGWFGALSKLWDESWNESDERLRERCMYLAVEMERMTETLRKAGKG